MKELIPGEPQQPHPLYSILSDLYNSHPVISIHDRKRSRPAIVTNPEGTKYVLVPRPYMVKGRREIPRMYLQVKYSPQRDRQLHPYDVAYVELYDLSNGSDDATIPPFFYMHDLMLNRKLLDLEQTRYFTLNNQI